MVNGQAMKQKLGSALAAQDSNGVAKALQLPPISTTKGPEPTPINRQSLTVNEVDYGSLLTSLLDACNAAECVSFHACLPGCFFSFRCSRCLFLTCAVPCVFGFLLLCFSRVAP